MTIRYNVVDLFSGMGGLSLGMSMTGRLQTRLAWDCFEEALNTFSLNHDNRHSPCAFISKDIRDNTEGALVRALENARASMNEIDVLVGGPPCEGFSQNRSLNSGGDWRVSGATRVNRFIDDPRNQLFRSFLDVAQFLRPKAVLIENVPAMVKHKNGETIKEILNQLKSIGYTARAYVINAADYGVPQLRRRTFIFGQKTTDLERTLHLLQMAPPTHVSYPRPSHAFDDDTEWLPGDAGYWTSVREAIGDLPTPTSQATDQRQHTYGEKANSQLRRFYRQGFTSYPSQHIARPVGQGGLSRIRALKSRQCANDLPSELKPKSFFHYSYSRLVWSDPARTITKFAYNVGSGMFAHPDQDRAITMREAARLQTFPDRVELVSTTIRNTSAMIGNAIPPLLGWQIGKQIVRYLDKLYALDRTEANSPLRTDAILRRMEGKSWSVGDFEVQPTFSFASETDLDAEEDDERELTE